MVFNKMCYKVIKRDGAFDNFFAKTIYKQELL